MAIASEDEFGGTERFLIERRLGAGAFGVVYRAFDRTRNASVALKTLHRADVEALYRLKQEFRSLQGITHRNLVELHELLAEGDRWFFTMELVEGTSFLNHVRGFTAGSPPTASPEAAGASTLSRERDSDEKNPEQTMQPRQPLRGLPLNADRLRLALRQAVAGVRALHAAGKLHRDIKPSNILVSRDGRVVLLDFGLVTELGGARTEKSLSLVGTPGYMSPEQGTGRAVTEASDWYSLGVMLFEALTGHRPFEGGFVEMMWEKQHRAAAAPSDLLLGIPSDLDQLCRDLLRRNPEERPTGEEILFRLAGAPTGPSHETAVQGLRTAPFVGREVELATLDAAYQATRNAGAVTVYVHGGSGLGKTVLVRRFLEDLRREGAIVLTGRCYERESVPYKALDSLVDSLSQHLKRLPSAEVDALLPRDVLALARLFPVLRRVEAIAGARRRVPEIPDSRELRRRAFGALRELLARIGEQQSLVLFIDDLQWGDVDSAALLTELMRAPDPPPMLFIGAYVTGEAETSPLLSTLSTRIAIETGVAREVVVTELVLSEARDLARTLLAGAGGMLERAETIARESGGNPLLINELVRYARTSSTVLDRTDSSAEAPWDTTLVRVIQARLRMLPPEVNTLLEIAAVAGQPVALAVAMQAADLPSADAPSAAALRQSHLLRTRQSDRGELIEPFHNRIREAIVANLSMERLRNLHYRLAIALEGTVAPDPEALALHFQEAGESTRAAIYAAAAADRASRALAFDRAAKLYRLAIDLGAAERPGGEHELRVRLGDALANAGRGGDAARAYLSASGGASSADALELQRRAADQLLRSGHLDEGIPLMEAVLARIGLRWSDSRLRALLTFVFHRVLIRLRGLEYRERDSSQISPQELFRVDTCWTVTLGLLNVNPARAKGFGNRHLLLALKAGEPYRAALAIAFEAGLSATDGWKVKRRTDTLLERATSLAGRVDHPHAIGIATMATSAAAYLQGKWSTCWDTAQAAEKILRERCTGAAWELDFTHIFSLRALFYLGEIRELSRRLPELILEAEQRDDLLASATLRIRHSYVALLASDEPAQARANLRDAIGHWSAAGFWSQHYYALVAETDIALATGDGERAWRILRENWTVLERSRLLWVQLFRIESRHLLARTALAAACEPGAARGRIAALLKSAEKDARRIERERVHWGEPLAALVRASVAATRLDPEEALRLVGLAEDGFETAGMKLHAAVARRRRGELQGGEAGRECVAGAEAWMAEQNIRSPARMCAMLAPGRWS
jgi:eukaryotic-like serine/threonine-protein kinase